MKTSFDKVKSYLADLNFDITTENVDEFYVVIDDESRGIKNLIIDCEDPILIIEQFVLELKNSNENIFKRLLQMNRLLVHGSFVLDESGRKVLFRDTLQLENLDLNELEASISALGMALAENADELIKFSK